MKNPKQNPADEGNCFVAGWGATKDSFGTYVDSSDVLLSVGIDIFQDSYCADSKFQKCYKIFNS